MTATTLPRPTTTQAPTGTPVRPPGARPPSRPSPFLTVGTELALVAVTVAAALGLTRLFTGGSFLGPVISAALAGHMVAWWCRRRGLGLLSSALVSAAGLVAALAWLVEPHTTTYLFPTGATWDAISNDLRTAWERFGDVKAPTVPLRGFILSAVAGAWVAATISDFFAFRVRARFEAMAPAFTLFVFGSILGADRLRLPVTALYLATLLMFLLWSEAARTSGSGAWFGGRGREGDAALLRTGAGLASIALVAAVLIGPHLPGAGSEGLVSWRDSKTGEGRSRVTVSPLVDIRGRLTEQSNVDLFTVGANAPSYWRLTSLDRFDGVIWSSLGTYQPSRGALPGALPGRVVRQDYVLGPLGTIWLPAAYRAERVTGVRGARFDRDSGSLLSEAQTADGLRYQVESLAPELTPAQLAAASPAIPAEVAEKYLDLPPTMPPEVAARAREVTATAATAFDKARRLQDWFRQTFVYDLNIGAGHDNDAMARFLATKRGYCEQFAGTFAAMARALGIPARVAVGFVPGQPQADGRYLVAGKDAHAWPEVYLGNYGWVAFEPTPGVGRTAPGTQSYTGVGLPEDMTQPEAPATTAVPTTVAANSSDVSTPEGEELEDQFGTAASDAGASPLRMAVVGLLLAGALYLVGVPLARRWLVNRRRRTASTPSEQVLVAWDEAQEALARAGYPRRAWETAGEYAARAAAAVGSAGPGLTRLAAGTDVAGFSATGVGTDDVVPAQQAAAAVAVRLRTQASRWRRLVWALDPRPLLAAGPLGRRGPWAATPPS